MNFSGFAGVDPLPLFLPSFLLFLLDDEEAPGEDGGMFPKVIPAVVEFVDGRFVDLLFISGASQTS